MPAMFDAEALVDGRRTAIMAPATILDQIRLTPDAECQNVDDNLEEGTEVYEVNICGRDRCRVGAETSIRSLATGRRYPLLVTRIRLVDCHALAPDDVAALGYPSREDFERTWQLLNTPTGWLIHLIPLAADAPLH